MKSDEASGDWNKILRYYSIQNIYLQNKDYYFCRRLQIFISRHLFPSTLNIFFSCFIDESVNI